MGNPKRQPWSQRQLGQAIDRYFQVLEADPGRRGGPSDLLAALGVDLETARQLAGADDGCGRLLRQAATRLRAHLETSPAWAGSNGTKAAFLLRQPLWDGLAYADKREAGPGTATIQVTFGPGGDAGEAFG